MKLEGNLETNQNTVPEYELYYVPRSAINTPPSSTVTWAVGVLVNIGIPLLPSSYLQMCLCL